MFPPYRKQNPCRKDKQRVWFCLQSPPNPQAGGPAIASFYAEKWPPRKDQRLCITKYFHAPWKVFVYRLCQRLMRLAITLHRCGSEPEGPRIDRFNDEWLTQLDLELKVEIGALEGWVRMWSEAR